MTQKETWFILIQDSENYGIGECGLLRGLSIDDREDYEQQLQWTCENIHLGKEELLLALADFPSIRFGVEQAFLSLKARHPFALFPSKFTAEEAPIAINGLIWMGEERFMMEQIAEKLEQGFRCIKMKIGAIDFSVELKLLKSIRERFPEDELELRVDANGAFSSSEVLQVLEQLSELGIHSIEQPIRQKQGKQMADLCLKTPLPIALDEELIGVHEISEKKKLLQTIRPQYIILKPSLIGGYRASMEWIRLAETMEIGWWVTSALESNIGLNAIAQWTYTLNNSMPQGLGTGSLFTNNFKSPLEVEGGNLFYRKHLSWQANLMEQLCI